MKKSVVIAFLFLVTVPLLVVTWLGWRSVVSEQNRYNVRVLELQQERLQEFATNQTRWLESVQTDLYDFLEGLRREPRESWPQKQNEHRLVYLLFEIDPSGELSWPNSSLLPLTEKEIAFRDLYETGNLFIASNDGEERSKGSPFQWTTWFDGPGQQWAFWAPSNDGSITGLVVDRTAFMAEAIAQLPDSGESASSSASRESFTLLNETGTALYTWGAADIDAANSGSIDVSLPTPLSMWSIQLTSTATTSPSWYQQPLVLSMAASLIGLAVVTLIAAYYLYSETRREFQRAQQRVSFVNQVSHEFKTPLTNIQLYSELLDESVESDKGNKYLGIIQEETHKLSRMIANVLTFARDQKATLKVNPRPLVPDDILNDLLETHRPGLGRKEITLQLNLDARHEMKLDVEILNQVFSNLLSNAEKYAPGSTLTIQSNQQEGTLTVTVEDTGPGIERSKRQTIFEPFVRLEDKTTEGVSGTGIGLSIARDLARLHGGDLNLQSGTSGASFTFHLKELA